MKNYIIILAAGAGRRSGNEIPKQFLILNDKPVVMHTIEKFYECKSLNLEILLILPQDYEIHWQQICLFYQFNIPHKVVIGGKERFHSVKNA